MWRERPGLGFVLIDFGLVLAVMCFFALPWVDGAGSVGTFPELRDALADAGDASPVSLAGRLYASWVAYTVVVILALLALPSGFGLNSRATIVCRTLTVAGALGAAFVHYVGVWQIFYDDTDSAGIGAWLVFPAYGLVLVGAAIGPGRTAVPLPVPGPPSVGDRPPGPPVPPPPRPPGGWPPPGPPPRDRRETMAP